MKDSHIYDLFVLILENWPLPRRIIIGAEFTRFGTKINGAKISILDDELALVWQGVGTMIIGADLLFHTVD